MKRRSKADIAAELDSIKIEMCGPAHTYAGRVRAYEQQGMNTSDAQAVADADDMRAMSGPPNAVELHRLRTVNAELLDALEWLCKSAISFGTGAAQLQNAIDQASAAIAKQRRVMIRILSNARFMYHARGTMAALRYIAALTLR